LVGGLHPLDDGGVGHAAAPYTSCIVMFGWGSRRNAIACMLHDICVADLDTYSDMHKLWLLQKYVLGRRRWTRERNCNS
jgi:hypothetical protein